VPVRGCSSGNLGILAVFLCHLFAEKVPAFQMPRTDFAFGIFLVAGAHPRNPHLHLGSVAERFDDLRRANGIERRDVVLLLCGFIRHISRIDVAVSCCARFATPGRFGLSWSH
jgi:hypothetical protein